MQHAPPVYRRLLGDRFGQMSRVLREFHGGCHVRTARGLLKVTRGDGFWSRVFAHLLRLPATTERAEVTLRIEPTAQGERWIRRFDARVLRTDQIGVSGGLCERYGPFSVDFALNADHGGLELNSDCVRFCGFCIPQSIAPVITAIEKPFGNGWYVDVRVSAAVGLLVRYSGYLEPT